MLKTRSQGALVRAFYALDLPEPARRACADLAAALRAAPLGDGVRWSRPEGYHLTLRFLGNVEPERLPDLGERVRAAVADVAPFAFRLGAAVAFPPRRPRVVAVAAEPEAPLAALAGRVEAGVVAAGLAPETRPFRPHLTLGRVRSRRLPDLAAAAAAAAGAPEVRVDEIVLYRSDLERHGAVHTALDRVVLGASGEARLASSP